MVSVIWNQKKIIRIFYIIHLFYDLDLKMAYHMLIVNLYSYSYEQVIELCYINIFIITIFAFKYV